MTPAKWAVLGPEDRASDACAGMAYPLVVKVLPSECEHKTELGLVKLRVQTAEEVDACAREFRERVGRPDMGVLVQEMISDGVEIVVFRESLQKFGCAAGDDIDDATRKITGLEDLIKVGGD